MLSRCMDRVGLSVGNSWWIARNLVPAQTSYSRAYKEELAFRV